ncbi:hypothetical protein WT08_01005 [Burkholderia sp. MSMB1552]|nr:hypothetical protein WT08_01005 [Burkholderia sp. MSMB1552]KWZ56318.1 hypothetical protein WS92_10725 [Burkholderia sp. MSMB1588]
MLPSFKKHRFECSRICNKEVMKINTAIHRGTDVIGSRLRITFAGKVTEETSHLREEARRRDWILIVFALVKIPAMFGARQRNDCLDIATFIARHTEALHFCVGISF